MPQSSNQRPTVANEQSNSFASSLRGYLGFSSGGKANSEIMKLKSELSFIDKGTSKQAEVSVRKLGEILGFSSTRPDNDQGTGPVVLWVDDESHITIGFELKTY